ncbi:MAG: hypothetical protein ACI9B7_000181 [Oleispira sp.]|jgi:hypothetical protein
MKKSLLALAIAASVAAPASASTAISGGIWLNHQQTTEDTGSDGSVREESTLGTMHNESLILYIDHKKEDSAWQLSSEWRTGQGSFSDSSNNNSGDTSGFHKLWVGYNFSADRQLVIGKSKNPFGFGTSNFWPGDMGLGGFGDQMDVGVKFSDKQDAISYDLAWFVADDFGTTSTDSMDDNGHWGSATTYRKVNTAVANIGFDVSENSTVGVSYQQGELQDLSGSEPDTDSIFGDHNAWDVWYTGTYGNVGVKAQVIGTQRNDLNKIGVGADEVKTMRQSLTVSYAAGPFSYYIDYTGVASDTDGNDASDMVAFAPGVSYNYGPGWIYAEYLTQSNYLDSNSDVADVGNAANDESKFSALYLTVDYYF